MFAGGRSKSTVALSTLFDLGGEGAICSVTMIRCGEVWFVIESTDNERVVVDEGTCDRSLSVVI